MFEVVGFIGCGNMGSALAPAVADSGCAERILLANRTKEKAETLAAMVHGEVVDNCAAARNCNLLFLGVKPQMMRNMLSELVPVMRERKDIVLCTMAAGLSCKAIQDMAGGAYPVIRIMPNTPASIGHGTIPFCGLGTTEEQMESFTHLLAPAGRLIPMDERLIDAASAVSGCGPAFVYLFIEALADGGVACGLPRDKAMTLAAAMLEGSAELMLETGKHPGVLKDAVTSPGGTTIQGVRKLEENGFRGAVMDAVIAAYEKTLALK